MTRIDEKEACLSGCSTKKGAWQAALPFSRFFSALNDARAVETAARAKKPDRLGWFPARLGGELELYER